MAAALVVNIFGLAFFELEGLLLPFVWQCCPVEIHRLQILERVGLGRVVLDYSGAWDPIDVVGLLLDYLQLS